jgi:hypothetical protein
MTTSPALANLIEAARQALYFIREEEATRSAAGTPDSDYEREPRDIAEALSSALMAVTVPCPQGTEQKAD